MKISIVGKFTQCFIVVIVVIESDGVNNNNNRYLYSALLIPMIQPKALYNK